MESFQYLGYNFKVWSYLGAVEPLQAWVVDERLGTALLELGPHRVVHFVAGRHEC